MVYEPHFHIKITFQVQPMKIMMTPPELLSVLDTSLHFFSLLLNFSYINSPIENEFEANFKFNWFWFLHFCTLDHSIVQLNSTSYSQYPISVYGVFFIQKCKTRTFYGWFHNENCNSMF